MAELYVIRNQLGHYWGKSKAWVDGSDARAVKRTAHRDRRTDPYKDGNPCANGYAPAHQHPGSLASPQRQRRRRARL